MKQCVGRNVIKMHLDMARPSCNSNLGPGSVPGSDGSSLAQIAEFVGGLKGQCDIWPYEVKTKCRKCGGKQKHPFYLFSPESICTLE